MPGGTRYALLIALSVSLGGSAAWANTAASDKDPRPAATWAGELAAPEALAGDIWDRLRDGLALPGREHALARAHAEWFGRHQDYLDRVAERARPFLHLIAEAVEERGMPAEIALLPVVESAFRPFAYSPGRAAGLWQFIPGTGRLYGLKQTWWYDGRRDVAASTRAALDYLQRLHRRFGGDWLLAIAAYNCGEGNVSKAIRKNRRRGKPVDFWSLDLPRETRGYVPRLLGLSRVVADPAAYGVRLSPLPDAPYLAQVDMGGQMDLALAAEMADLPLEEVYRLNPGFNRWATDPEGPHRLLLPLDRAEGFRERLAQLPPEGRIRWRRHRIRNGETLSHIAKRYRTTVAMLKTVNDLSGTTIRAGAYLLIPVAQGDPEDYVLSTENRRRAHLERRRDGTRTTHLVRTGDTLWDIAREHGVSYRRLASWNAMAPGDTLRPGRKLVIWKPRQAGGEAAIPGGKTEAIRYTVRRGDSLWLISRRFKVAVDDLRAWNDLPKGRYLKPGQTLRLYIDVTRQSEPI
jgi:membrane-bound lytic murein transglycosylase D